MLTEADDEEFCESSCGSLVPSDELSEIAEMALLPRRACPSLLAVPSGTAT
jgi:hypothetical protein